MRFAIATLLAVLGMSVAQAQTLHVLTVGVDICEDKEEFEVNAYTEDARKVLQILKKQSPIPVNGKSLTGRKATRKAVLRDLNDIKKRAKPGDSVFVYFSIHGDDHPRDGFLMHTMRNIKDDEFLDKVLYGTDVAEVLNALPCPSILAIDACHAGAMARIPLKNTALFCSSDEDGVSAGHPTGYFGGAVIDGLKGEADWNEDYEVTLKELSSYVRWQTPKRAHMWQVPEVHIPNHLKGWVVTKQPKPQPPRIPLAKD